MSMEPLSVGKTPVATGLDESFPVLKEADLISTDANAVEVAPPKVPPAYLKAVSELNYAENPVLSVDFNKVARRALPKLGRGDDSFLARGEVRSQGVAVQLGTLPGMLSLFRMQVGNHLGGLKPAFERLEQALAGGADGPEAEKNLFKALVEFGEATKKFQNLQAIDADPSLPPNFDTALSGVVDQVAAFAATLNAEGRLSQQELTKRVHAAESTATKTTQVITAVNAQSLSQQLRAGTMTDAVRELLSEHGYFLKADLTTLCDAAGQALSDADLDALGDQVIDWAAAKLVEAEDRLTSAEDKFIGGLSDEERATYEQLRHDYDAMKQGIPPRNEREAVTQAFLKTKADFPDDQSVDDAFIDRLMTGGIPEGETLTPAQQAFLDNLGAYAPVTDGVRHLTDDPAVRKFFSQAVKLVNHPSSPAAANLVKAFVSTVKALNTVVRAAVSQGKDPFRAIMQAFNAFYEGLHLGKKGAARRAERLKHKPLAGKPEPLAGKKKPGGSVTTVKPTDDAPRLRKPVDTPEALTAAKLKAGKQWHDLLDTDRDDLRDTTKRMDKARRETIHQETIAEQEAYVASVRAEGNKAHADQKAE